MMRGTPIGLMQVAAVGMIMIMAIGLGPSAASAQDALGSGNVLDNNLNPYSGGVNSATRVEDFRLRNQVITGNVAGGRGFRGSVGYTAETDFRGRLGSNDLFRFRADSLFSSPALFSLGRTYEQLRFGEGMGIVEVPRSGSGASGATLNDSAPFTELEITQARLKLDRVAFAGTTAAAGRTAVEPSVVGTVLNDAGEALLLKSSPLRGMFTTPMRQSFDLLGLTTLDEARLREDYAAGRPVGMPGVPFDTRFETPSVDPRIAGDPVAAQYQTEGTAEYRQVLDRIIERYAKERNIDLDKQPEVIKTLDEQYRLLRERLIGQVREQTERQPGMLGEKRETEITDRSTASTQPPGPATESGTTATDKPPGDLSEEYPQPALPPIGLPRRPGESEYKLDPQTFEPESFGPILRHGQKLPPLSAADQTRLNELMASAEQKLHAGEYFWAERRFERALRFSPGNPVVTAGIAHAQLGAGLFLSSSLTLRTLFAHHPEMIDITYDEKSLPPRDRLQEIVRSVQKHLEDPGNEQAGYAFLLAYLGRQLGDRSLMEQGLKTLERADPKGALPPLLKSIWLEGTPGDNAPVQDAPAPASEPAPAPNGK